MAPIRKGDGTAIAPKGIAEVRKGDGTILWSAGSDIPDSVVHHYDATDTSTSAWDDLAGDVDLQPAGGPTLMSDGIGGLQSWSFDGVDDAFEESLSTPIEQDFTVFFVAEPRDGSDGQRLLGDSEPNTHPTIQIASGRWAWGFSVERGSSADTDPHIFTLVYGSGESKEFRIDGSVAGTDSDLEENITNIAVGYRPSGNDRFTDMLAGELIYDESVENVSDVERRLSEKWGISI